MGLNEIMKYANSLFDAVGMVDNLLILGLESRADRDLDTFIVSDGEKWRAPGFHRHFTPRISLTVREIQKRGFRVEQKRYSKLNIKELAVRSGMAKWGKNSLIIHPKFGPWLRFVVIETDAPLLPAPLYNLHTVYPGCEDCNKCLLNCPVKGLLEPFRVINKQRCLANLQLDKPTQREARRCDKCLTACMPQSGK